MENKPINRSQLAVTNDCEEQALIYLTGHLPRLAALSQL